MLVSKQGIGIRMSCDDISIIGRATQGVRVMKLNEGDELAAAAKIVTEEVDENEEISSEKTNNLKSDNEINSDKKNIEENNNENNDNNYDENNTSCVDDNSEE